MENHLRTATFIANLLDNRFHFFGIRFGLNGVLGMIPIVGDISTLILSAYLIWIAVELKVPIKQLFRMVGNIVENFLIGLIPVVGDYYDFFHKANLKNLQIIKEYKKQVLIEGEVIRQGFV